MNTKVQQEVAVLVEYWIHHMQLARVRVQTRPASLESVLQPMNNLAELDSGRKLRLQVLEHLQVETMTELSFRFRDLQLWNDRSRLYDDLESSAWIREELDRS